MGLSGLSGSTGLGGLLPALNVNLEPQWFQVEITTTAPNQTYSWQIVSGTSISATTEWGDGQTSTHTSSGVFTHTYANAGVYTLRLQASFESAGAFHMRPNVDRSRLTRLLSAIPAFIGLESLNGLLNGCSGLTGQIPVDFLRYVTQVKNLSNLMLNCPGLTGQIPVDFLRYVTQATSINNLFRGCSGLTGKVPVDFLRYVTQATNLNSLLLGCSGVELQADILGPDPQRFLNQSVNFASAFREIGSAPGTPQGTAPALWTYDYGTGTPNSTNCFFGGSTATLSNWAQIPAAWGGPA